MAMSLRDYLGYRCQQMLAMERDILKMNNTMTGEVQEPMLKEQFQRHGGTTEQQIRNLEMVINRLGQNPGEGQGEGFLGNITERLGLSEGGGSMPVTRAMMEDHQKFMGMNPPQNIIEINNALEGDKVEHMEISSYMGLIALAKQVGEMDVAQMLQQNLEGERGMRDSIESNLTTLLQRYGGQGRMAA